ncbi:MAG: tRNA pseudouridine(55) synthase TruB [Deltaproteobacteria bacterium]|nr:tRNA pseudouridine(55) synthase TruB [Deltaproteobacteria bacterium]
MDGFLVINKPKGITSHDVVTRVKKATNSRKVGHTGTLDPFATGVLTLCINEATSLARFFENDVKEYIALMKVGEETDTYDIDGRVISKCDVSDMDCENIVSVLKGFLGVYMQTPPMYSAIKKGGVPLYKLARKGIEVLREPRAVNIYEMDIIESSIPYIRFRVVCSKGTYIRSLCHDIGEKLGCGAYLSSLHRVRSGGFAVEDSLSLDSISSDTLADKVITIEDMFKDQPSIFSQRLIVIHLPKMM